MNVIHYIKDKRIPFFAVFMTLFLVVFIPWTVWIVYDLDGLVEKIEDITAFGIVLFLIIVPAVGALFRGLIAHAVWECSRIKGMVHICPVVYFLIIAVLLFDIDLLPLAIMLAVKYECGIVITSLIARRPQKEEDVQFAQ